MHHASGCRLLMSIKILDRVEEENLHLEIHKNMILGYGVKGESEVSILPLNTLKDLKPPGKSALVIIKAMLLFPDIRNHEL